MSVNTGEDRSQLLPLFTFRLLGAVITAMPFAVNPMSTIVKQSAATHSLITTPYLYPLAIPRHPRERSLTKPTLSLLLHRP